MACPQSRRLARWLGMARAALNENAAMTKPITALENNSVAESSGGPGRLNNSDSRLAFVGKPPVRVSTVLADS